MTRPIDGGPAFPCDVNIPMERYGHDGMTLRDYFAAHAPTEPWPRWQPVMTTPRPEGEWPNGILKSDYPSNLPEIEAWDAERERQRLIQWPYAWADEMLEQRKIKMTE